MSQPTPQLATESMSQDLASQHDVPTIEIADETPVPPTLDERGNEIRRDLAEWHLMYSRYPALRMCRR